jgi:transcriptional regulator with GAF, ATPase, and Fis domain
MMFRSSGVFMPSPSFVHPKSSPELRSLYEIALLPQPGQLQDYFLSVMAVLSDHFSIGYSALLVREYPKESLQVEALYGVGKESHPLCCSNPKGTIGKVLESRQPMVIPNLAQEPFYAEIPGEAKGAEKIRPPLLCIPILSGDETLGVMNIGTLYGPRDEFNEDLRFLSILSAILSPVIRNYQLNGGEPQKTGKAKAKSSQLEEVLEERLTEVLNRVDPYVESRAKLGLLDDIIALVEKILIRSALKRVDYVQVAAAALLGINRNTLRKKIKDLKIKIRS